MQANPLKQYFRQYKIYIKLPTGTQYYAPDVIEFTDLGEIGVLPMTGKDELILKNPDALLNGEALIEVIKSCVPAVKNVKRLLSNDIDALMTAIRFATFGDALEIELTCPECEAENLFKVDLGLVLDRMDFLDNEYVVNLDSGVSVFLKPHSFPDILKNLHSEFERSKLQKILVNDNLTEEQKSAAYSKVFKEMSILTYELVANAIVKVVDESNDVNVSERAFIEEWLFNIESKSVELIQSKLVEINKVGVKKKFSAECERCKYTWEADMDFNPTNFS